MGKLKQIKQIKQLKQLKQLKHNSYKIVILLIILLITACKPKQIIQERTIIKIDSTENIILKEELKKKSVEIETLKTNLEKLRDENVKLSSEMSSHVIYYDTGATIKPDGQYPIASETIIQSKSIYERTIKEMEILINQYERKTDSLINTNKIFQDSIKLLKDENKNLSEKITPTTGFNFKLFFAGVGTGILICIIFWLLIKRRRI